MEEPNNSASISASASSEQMEDQEQEQPAITVIMDDTSVEVESPPAKRMRDTPLSPDGASSTMPVAPPATIVPTGTAGEDDDLNAAEQSEGDEDGEEEEEDEEESDEDEDEEGDQDEGEKQQDSATAEQGQLQQQQMQQHEHQAQAEGAEAQGGESCAAASTDNFGLTRDGVRDPVIHLLTDISRNQERTNMLIAQSTAAMEEIRDEIHQSAQASKTTYKTINDLLSHFKMMASINSTIDGSCLTDLNAANATAAAQMTLAETTALSEITAADVTPLHPCRYPEISEHAAAATPRHYHRSDNIPNYLPTEKVSQLRTKAVSKENFCVHVMREIFSEDERLRDVNINGLNKPQLSPTFKRIRFILDRMHDQYGRCAEAEIMSVEAKAIRAMDEANRRLRVNHNKKHGY